MEDDQALTHRSPAFVVYEHCPCGPMNNFSQHCTSWESCARSTSSAPDQATEKTTRCTRLTPGRTCTESESSECSFQAFSAVSQFSSPAFFSSSEMSSRHRSVRPKTSDRSYGMLRPRHDRHPTGDHLRYHVHLIIQEKV